MHVPLDDLDLQITVTLILVLFAFRLYETRNDVLLRILSLVTFQQTDQPDHLILDLVVLLYLVGELDDGICASISERLSAGEACETEHNRENCFNNADLKAMGGTGTYW